MKRALLHAMDGIDRTFAAVSPGLIPEAPALIIVLFHSLFRTRAEVDQGLVDPQQGVTIAEFRMFIEAFLEAGYSAIGPDELVSNRPESQKHFMITFDDGYFNNHLALATLEEFNVPATFFISSSHVIEQRSFWWDVLYREVRGSGSARRRAVGRFKLTKAAALEAELISMFGKRALTPQGDVDRPFTSDELRDFARSRLVRLGNHTADHAILTNYSAEEMASQIGQCQRSIEAIGGHRPTVIAYPNGNYSPTVVKASWDAGLRAGLTLRPRKNPLHRETSAEQMTLGRFILWGGGSIRNQCAVFRSAFAPSRFFRKLYWGYGS